MQPSPPTSGSNKCHISRLNESAWFIACSGFDHLRPHSSDCPSSPLALSTVWSLQAVAAVRGRGTSPWSCRGVRLLGGASGFALSSSPLSVTAVTFVCQASSQLFVTGSATTAELQLFTAASHLPVTSSVAATCHRLCHSCLPQALAQLLATGLWPSDVADNESNSNKPACRAEPPRIPCPWGEVTIHSLLGVEWRRAGALLDASAAQQLPAQVIGAWDERTNSVAIGPPLMRFLLLTTGPFQIVF